ncbi:MAG: phytanoyl-CoA dioxygenase family protein [Alphaproteobacteria bacterium]
MLRLDRISASAGTGPICDAMERDGAVIVEDALGAGHIAGFNKDLDDIVEAMGPGLRHPTDEFFVEFYGPKTVRLDGLPDKSKTFVEIMELPMMQEVANHFLLANCQDYLLNTAQLIQIGPSENAQLIHRDEDAWPEMPANKPLLQVEAMYALTDFTVANGATQVVPGSHRWAPDREAEPQEITRAEMKAGSALLYFGTTLHGGGANTTTDVNRRGMFYGYVLGWLRTEENLFLTVPLEKVRHMPTRVQELLGYKAHYGIGVVDVGSPMALLQ